MALPSNVGFCLITGRFIRAILDGEDAGKDPDGIPIEGLQVSFTSSLFPATVRDMTATPPVTVVIDPVRVTTNENGVLVSPDGTEGVYLVASNDPDIDPSGWTYQVMVTGPTFAPVKFSFIAPVDGVVDLATVIPVPSSPGSTLPAWQAAVEATQAAAALAVAAAESVAPGEPNGTATLDGDAVVPDSQLPERLGESSLSSRYARAQKGSLTTVIGDSIDQGSDDDPNRGYGGSWFSQFCIVSDQRATLHSNKGIGGDWTEAMLARIQTDVINGSADICVLGGATNDIGFGVASAVTRANIVAMIDMLEAAGKAPVLRTVPPTDNAGTGITGSVALNRAAMQKHNAWIWTLAAQRGYPILDIYTALADPTTGGFKAGLTTDGTHPTRAGVTAIITHLLSEGIPSIFRGSVPLVSSPVRGYSLTAQGTFITDRGDGLATNWDYYGGGVNDVMLLAGTDGIAGQWQRVIGNASAGIGVIYQGIPAAADATTGSVGWAIGDVIALSGIVRSVGVVPIQVQVEGMPLRAMNGDTFNGRGTFYAKGTIPSGTTDLTLSMSVNNPGGVVDFAQVSVINLTRLGLV